jgi:hypothetical protein
MNAILVLSCNALLCFSSTQRRRAFAGRHVFVLSSSSGLRGHKRTYRTILESADHALFKMVRYVLLRPLRPELKVEGSVRFLDGVKNCTDSVHKFSRAFLLCYEFVQFLTPSKNLTDPSTFRCQDKNVSSREDTFLSFR